MRYIKQMRESAVKQYWKKVLVMLLVVAFVTGIAIFAYNNAYEEDGYWLYSYDEGYLSNAPYWDEYGYLEDNSGYAGYGPYGYEGLYEAGIYLEDHGYLDHAPHYVYDSDTGMAPEYMYNTPYDYNHDNSQYSDYDFEFFESIGMLKVVENGVILHDVPDLPDAPGYGYIGIQPLSDEILPLGATWAALASAILAAPTTVSPAGYSVTPFVITIMAPEILAPSTGFTRLLVGDGRHVVIESGLAGGQNVRLVKTGTYALDGGRHFVVHSRSRLDLDGITLTRSDAVVAAESNGGGVVVRNSTLHVLGGSIIEYARTTTTAWFSPAAIYAGSGSYLFLHDAIIRNNVSHGDSGGVGVRTASIAEMHYPTQIYGNRAIHAGGGSLGGGVSIASTENRLRPNYAMGGPRAPGVRCTVFTMYGGSITNNFANQDGGGVRIGIDATFIMHDGLIAYNYSNRRGGGVEAVEDSLFRWYGGTVRDNGRNAAGDITTQTGGGFSIVGGSVLEVPATPGNRYLTGNASLLAGGGLYLSTAGAGAGIPGVTPSRINVPSTLIIPNGAPFIINGNHTDGDGGGIYLLNATFTRLGQPTNFGANVTMNDGVITNNTALQSGGGLSVSGLGSEANLTAGLVQGNTALNGGGASVINDAEFTLSGTSRIDGNLALATGTYTANGGGVFAAADATFHFLNTNPNAITNNIARAIGPDATANGGGFVIDGNILNMAPDTTFTGNRVEALNGATANGGGLAVLSGTFTLQTGRTVSGNTAHATGANSTALGGGVLLVNSTFTAASGSNIINNEAVAVNGATARGGGVSVSGGTHTIAQSANVTGNEAVASGAGALAQGGGVIVTGGVITIADGANVTGNGASASGSLSVAQGGGFAAIGGQLNLNIDVEGNFAEANGSGTVQGGGAFVGGGNITIIGRDITNNEATTDGGNIYGVGLAMSGGTFSMSAGTEITGNISTIGGGGNVFGGGVAMLLAADGITGGTFEMSGGDILNNSASRGGGVWMIGGTMNLSGGSVRNNSATHGGGIYMTGAGSTLNMTGGTIGHANPALGNEATRAGGGVHLSNGAHFAMRRGGTVASPTYGTIIGNSVSIVTGWNIAAGEGGGGIMATTGSIVDLYIGVISGNSASYGGGIQARTGTILTMRAYPNGSGARIYNNTIIGGGVLLTAGGGGVIVHGAASVFNMYSGTIGHDNPALGNRSSRAAGGVYVAGGTFNMRAHADTSIALPRIVGNTAEGTATIDGGGGIEIWGSGATFNMYDGIIENNRALHGGGIYLEGGHLNMHGGIIQNNRYNATGGLILHGGGVKFGNTAVVTFNMTGGTIRNNRATQGGGVRAQVATPNVAHFNMSGGYIYGNEATTNGGGVWINNPNAVLTMTGGTIGRAAPAGLPDGAPNPNANTAANSGGGVAVLGGASLIMNEGGTIANPTSGAIIGNHAAGSGNLHGGGGVLVEASSFIMNAGTIAENITTGTGGSHGGAGVFLRQNAHFTMHDGHIHNNIINGGGGGGVRLFGSTYVMHGGIIEYNHSGSPSLGVGGGVHVQSGTFTIHDGIIRNNSAPLLAGGVRVLSEDGDLSNTYFIMHGGRIYGNSAGTNGGGVNVYKRGDHSNNATFLMHGGTIGGEAPANLPDGDPNPYSNTAIDGGGVWVGNGARFNIEEYVPVIIVVLPASLSTGEIIGNIATADGGGIWVADNSTVTAANATITHNTAGNMGGGIFTQRYEYACPITNYPGAAGVLPADVAYSNLTLTDVIFNHNESYRRYTPPRNAWDVIAATAFTQTSFPTSPPPIHNHPLNNCDINFRNPGLDFDFHKTNEQIFNQAQWDWGNPGWVNSILLPGAQFSLFRYIGAGTPATLVNPSNLYPAGNWVYEGSAASTGLIGTPISFKLFYGVYFQLVEVLAPVGFQAPVGQWQIRYGASGLGIAIVGGTAPTIHYIPCDCNSNNCEGGSRFVGNMRQFELPLAGGLGATRFTIAGFITLCLAGLTSIIIFSLKKDKTKTYSSEDVQNYCKT